MEGFVIKMLFNLSSTLLSKVTSFPNDVTPYELAGNTDEYFVFAVCEEHQWSEGLCDKMSALA